MCVLLAVSPALAKESDFDSLLCILSINDYFTCIISLIYSERINKLYLLCRGKKHFIIYAMVNFSYIHFALEYYLAAILPCLWGLARNYSNLLRSFD